MSRAAMTPQGRRWHLPLIVLATSSLAVGLLPACNRSAGDDTEPEPSSAPTTVMESTTTTQVTTVPFSVSHDTVLRLASQEGYKIEVRLQFGKPQRVSAPGPFDSTAGAASSCSGADAATDLAVPLRVEAINRTPNFPLVLGAGFSRAGSATEMGTNEVLVQTFHGGDPSCRPLSTSATSSYLFGFVANEPSAFGESRTHDYYLIVKDALTPGDPSGGTLSTVGFGCNIRGGGMRIGDRIFRADGDACRGIFKLA